LQEGVVLVACLGIAGAGVAAADPGVGVQVGQVVPAAKLACVARSVRE
jgi:hypothetical protein